MTQRWDLRLTPDAVRWYRGLSGDDAGRIRGLIDALWIAGPGLGRPRADTLRDRRFRNMKELRTGSVRILFAFNRTRQGMILLGGDKAGDWRGWYEKNMGRAEQLYARHATTAGRETTPWTKVRSEAGGRSEGGGR